MCWVFFRQRLYDLTWTYFIKRWQKVCRMWFLDIHRPYVCSCNRIAHLLMRLGQTISSCLIFKLVIASINTVWIVSPAASLKCLGIDRQLHRLCMKGIAKAYFYSIFLFLFPCSSSALSSVADIVFSVHRTCLKHYGSSLFETQIFTALGLNVYGCAFFPSTPIMCLTQMVAGTCVVARSRI